jgi:5-methyltetrahydropteroyltriglutamate--homocysteine methyltransferase
MPAERLLTEGLDLIDSIVADIPGIDRCIHLCRGNNNGMWMAQGGYSRIAKALFGRTHNFDTYLLEYDDDRSGGFEPLQYVPDGKLVVLGLVSTKRPTLEHADTLGARIVAAGRFFPHEQLALSTQCGFASNAGGNPITPDVEAAKLKLVANVARAVWT